jgi:acyl-CoA dehydrogenase
VPDPAEVLTCSVGDGASAVPAGDRWVLRGTVDVPWARVSSHLAVLASGPDGPVLAVTSIGRLQSTEVANLAGEPRGTLSLDGVLADGVPLTEREADEFKARFALARAVQISAALEQVLTWTVQYAGERQQFGRPLAKFQAIQIELAEMAGEVTAVAALVNAAVEVLGRGGDCVLAAAAAKVRAGSAVEVVSRLAHQVHGAIGFTQEYKLHHLTRRLWSWRDEAGSELHWSRVLGAGLLAADDHIWASLTDVL